MRILHILDHSLPHRSGYALSIDAMLHAQRERGWHTIHLTGPAQGPMPEQEQHARGWHFFRTRLPPAANSPLPCVRRTAALHALATRLRHVVRLTRPDVLHAHGPATNGLAALHVARRCGLPVVYETHAWWQDGASSRVGERAGCALERLVARHADALCAPTRAALTGLRIHAGRTPASVIPLAYQVAEDAEPVRVPPPDSGLTLACAGPLIGAHGVELLLEALPRVAMFHPDLRVRLICTGAVPDSLRAHAAERRVDGQVSFYTHVAPEAVPAHLARADLVLFPRQRGRHADLFAPFHLLEAMAHGCPVLASDVGGHRELVQHGRNGILFDAGSSAALGDTLLALLSEPACLPRLGSTARIFVAAQRNWHDSVDGYVPLYARLLGRRR